MASTSLNFICRDEVGMVRFECFGQIAAKRKRTSRDVTLFVIPDSVMSLGVLPQIGNLPPGGCLCELGTHLEGVSGSGRSGETSSVNHHVRCLRSRFIRPRRYLNNAQPSSENGIQYSCCDPGWNRARVLLESDSAVFYARYGSVWKI
ncbi:hypothetical protein BV898_07555 [Hypsibius exemplaris]|uniref:Uncharacterized protein n=1 Tax=Hypsibius exemplaris TaxID=2072580 RepID=A0A1W0WT33_HYPEX|nr:hypothetical protein BV898_07555 [Hypsibius exemplaris]